MKKIISYILFMTIGSQCILAEASVIDNISITMKKQPKVEYKLSYIPIIVLIRNNNSFPIRVLKPNDKQGKSLYCFGFIFQRMGKMWTSSSVIGQNPDSPNRNLLEYISIAPNQEVSFLFMLDNMLKPRLIPGQYKVSLQYKNLLGENCLKGDITAKNELYITFPEEQEEKIKPEYISYKQALEIAKKENTLKYDNSIKAKIFLSDGVYTVTFPRKMKPMTFGPDFTLQVKIDAKSGKILAKVLGN